MELFDNIWYCSSFCTLYVPPVGGVPVVAVLVIGDFDNVCVPGCSIGVDGIL